MGEGGRKRRKRAAQRERQSDHKVPFAPKPQRQRVNHAPEREKEREDSLIEFFVMPAHLTWLGAALNDGKKAVQNYGQRLRESIA